MSEFTFTPIVDSWEVASLLCLLVVPLFLRPDFASLTDTRRWILNGLRIALILLVLLAILRPTIIHTEKKPQPSAMVVMVDTSRSMGLMDLPGSRSRWDGMKDTLRSVEPHLAALSQKVTIRVYGFDRGAAPIEFEGGKIKFPEKPEGKETDHGGSLDDVRRNETGQRLAAVFLLGDGAQAAYSPRTPAQQVASQLADQGTPLYTLAYGQVRSERDVAVENLQDQYSVFVKNQLPIKAQVRIQGYANQEIPVRVTVTDADQKVVWKDLRLVKALPDEQGSPLEVEFNYVPEKQGQYKLTLSADLQAEELVSKNNELTAFVTVLDGGIRVLYLESSLEWWEPKFLRRTLDTSRDIKLDFLWVDRRRGGEKSQAEIASVLAAQEYDVYIIGDVHSSLLGGENVKKIAEAVNGGKGLLILGGYYTFDLGGYQDTALDKVLPVTMEKNRRQGLDEPIIERFHLVPPGGIAMLPTGEHFITDLTPGAENLATWKKLPKLDRAIQFSGLALRSRVLVQSADEKPVPLLVAGVYGSGRTLAMAGNSTWHWAMQGFGAEHTRFWRRTMLWLAGKDAIREDVWIDLAQRRFNPGAKVTFTAGIKNSESEVVKNADLKAELLLPDGKTQPVPLASKQGQYEGSIPKMATVGDHVIVVSAKRGDKTIAARARFTVFDQDLELGNPSANPSFLQQLSRITEKHGGRMVASEDLAALLAELEKAPPKNEVEVRSKWQLADTPLDAWTFFLAVIALLSIEWYLRKAWGMA